MQKPSKISFNQLKNNMQAFLKFPEIEKSILAEAKEKVDQAILSQTIDTTKPPIDILEAYLTEKSFDVEERLKILISLTGGSLERIKRIFEAQFPNKNWTQFKNNKNMRSEILSILINPNQATIFIPEFIKRNIALPPNWIELISNKDYLTLTTVNTLRSKYSVHTGNALEEAARKVVNSNGHKLEKGPVEIVDGKEIDIAIPNTKNPRVLIMSSYNLTTSSSQTSRANEQLRMYDRIGRANRHNARQNKPQIFFINIIDGGGWLARNKDLEKMWDECDYCFCYKNLNNIKEVLNYAFNENHDIV